MHSPLFSSLSRCVLDTTAPRKPALVPVLPPLMALTRSRIVVPSSIRTSPTSPQPSMTYSVFFPLQPRLLSRTAALVSQHLQLASFFMGAAQMDSRAFRPLPRPIVQHFRTPEPWAQQSVERQTQRL